MEQVCEGKVAVVTGASRGLGEAIAHRLAEEGARVVVSARTLDPDPAHPGSISETAAAINAAGGEAVPIRCDLADADSRRALIEASVEQLGPVDILVNNGAITYLGPFVDFTEKRWRLMVEVQLRAPFELSQLVVPSMRERGCGWILNISSRAANHAVGPPFEAVQTAGFSVYGMVKAGLERLTTAMAAELYDDGIAVNALAPWDNVRTPGTDAHDLVEGFPLEGPEWMAEAALALCSARPKQLTGRVAYSQPLLGELQRRPKAR